MKHINQLMPKAIKKAGISKQIQNTELVRFFKEELGSFFDSDTKKSFKVLYLKDKIITVACLSNKDSEKLKFKEAEILRKINEKYHKTVIESIRILT